MAMPLKGTKPPSELEKELIRLLARQAAREYLEEEDAAAAPEAVGRAS